MGLIGRKSASLIIKTVSLYSEMVGMYSQALVDELVRVNENQNLAGGQGLVSLVFIYFGAPIFLTPLCFFTYPVMVYVVLKILVFK